jgi:hypothetical protein
VPPSSNPTSTSSASKPSGPSLGSDSLLLAGFCGFLFFFGLSYFGLLGADEPRYAQVAQEMFARHDWITPTLGGKAWLEKPVLYYWQTILAYKVFGVSDWAARLSSAVDATLMVVAVDRRQAQVILGYIRGLLAVPLLADRILNETAEAITSAIMLALRFTLPAIGPFVAAL